MPEFITYIVIHRYTIIGAILLACFVGYVAYLNFRLNEFKSACAKFRTTILSELVGLYPLPTEWPKRELAILDILQSKFPTLQASIIEFSNALPWYKKFFFLRAWRTYRLGKDGRDIDHQYYWQYVPHSGHGIENGKHIKHDNRLTYQSNFKLNIDRLLSYAK